MSRSRSPTPSPPPGPPTPTTGAAGPSSRSGTDETLRTAPSSLAAAAGSTPFRAPGVKTRRSRCYSVDAIRAPSLSPPVDDTNVYTLPRIQETRPLIDPGASLNQLTTNKNGSDSTMDARGSGSGSVGRSATKTKTRPRAASAAQTRPRGYSVGVRLPPRTRAQTLLDVEAQTRPRSSSSSSAALDITVPEAHDSDIADHNGTLDDDVVGLLDVVDPEVGTVNHLQNVTNGIMFPHFPMLWSRRPHLTLNSKTDEYTVVPELPDEQPATPSRTLTQRGLSLIPGYTPKRRDSAPAAIPLTPVESDDKKLAVMEEEISKEHELDKHVRKVLQRQQRKQKAKAALRGLWAYLKTPMGMVTAVYGFLVAFWGAAIVLFLLGWIPTSSKDTQDKWVEISSQVTNGLFTITGVGLIPWRAIDTYRMSVIWTIRMRMVRRRAARGLPPAKDNDDLPAQLDDHPELLSPAEADKLKHQQDKFAESQTWYRATETATHRAFPIKWALWNTIFMDGNSFFQCILCGCMWGMNRHQRPAWTTGSLIPLSFLCGIAAAVLIWQGGVRSKKTKAVTEQLRKTLGVDEEVPEVVKRPRRATLSGTSPLAETHAPLPAVPPVGTLSKSFGNDVLDIVVEGDERLEKSPAQTRRESL